MTDYAEMRRYHEERKMHRFFKRCDSATFYLAVAMGALSIIIFCPAIMRTAQALWRGL